MAKFTVPLQNRLLILARENILFVFGYFHLIQWEVVYGLTWHLSFLLSQIIILLTISCCDVTIYMVTFTMAGDVFLNVGFLASDLNVFL